MILKGNLLGKGNVLFCHEGRGNSKRLVFSLIREQANTASASNYARRKPRHFIPNKKLLRG